MALLLYVIFILVGSVVERIKAPFLWRPSDHDRVIYVQRPPSSHTLLRLWIRRFIRWLSLLDGFEQAAN